MPGWHPIRAIIAIEGRGEMVRFTTEVPIAVVLNEDIHLPPLDVCLIVIQNTSLNNKIWHSLPQSAKFVYTISHEQTKQLLSTNGYRKNSRG